MSFMFIYFRFLVFHTFLFHTFLFQMACEQVLYSGYTFPQHLLLSSKPVPDIADCAQSCCGNSSCGTYTYNEKTTQCDLFRLPDQLIYAPFPTTKNMIRTGDPQMISAILMKRKVATWIPWIMLIAVILLIAYVLWWQR